MSLGKILFLITARKGSEGLPNKNFKTFLDFPLIHHSFKFATSVAREEDEVCISTNDHQIIDFYASKNNPLPFIRPESLSTNKSSSDSVIAHALEYYKSCGVFFEYVMLLQPTSPLRVKDDFTAIVNLMDSDTEMVVSVKNCKDNPYFNMFTEDSNYHLQTLVECETITRRQDVPTVYAYNGAFYFFKVSAFAKNNKMIFDKIKKHLMPIYRSIDIDTQEDWDLAVYYAKKNQYNG